MSVFCFLFFFWHRQYATPVISSEKARRAGAEGTRGCRLAWTGEASVYRAIARQLGSHLTWLQQVVSRGASQVPGRQEAPRLPPSEWILSSVTRDTEAAPVLLQPAKAFPKVVSF